MLLTWDRLDGLKLNYVIYLFKKLCYQRDQGSKPLTWLGVCHTVIINREGLYTVCPKTHLSHWLFWPKRK